MHGRPLREVLRSTIRPRVNHNQLTWPVRLPAKAIIEKRVELFAAAPSRTDHRNQASRTLRAGANIVTIAGDFWSEPAPCLLEQHLFDAMPSILTIMQLRHPDS